MAEARRVLEIGHAGCEAASLSERAARVLRKTCVADVAFEEADDHLEVELQARQRRAQLVACPLDELFLESAQAAVGDVADDDDATTRFARGPQRLGVGFIP